MKIRNLLLAGLAIFGLAACSNDNTDALSGGETTPEAEFDTYLSITLSSPDYGNSGALTRTVAGTTKENEIKIVNLYLVQNGIVKYVVEEIELADNKTGAVSVPEGPYQLFVEANPNGAALVVGAEIDNLAPITGVTKETAKDGLYKGNFLMTTAVNGPDFSQAGTSVSINASHTKTKPATADVKVDRLAVKIVNANEATKPIEVKGSLADLGYITKLELKGLALVNGQTQFNLFQKWETPTSGAVMGTYINTPHDSEKGYYNALVDLTSESEMPTFTNDVYTTENRPDFVLNKMLTAGMGETTAVIYQTQVNGGGTFYYVANKIFTEIDEVQKLEEFSHVDFDAIKGNAKELRKLNIKVYEDGLMYYTYFIKDPKNKVEYTSPGTSTTTTSEYYGVLRNTQYSLTITSISNIGDDIPGGGKVTPENPNPPINPDDTYINVAVTANPWKLSEIGIEL